MRSPVLILILGLLILVPACSHVEEKVISGLMGSYLNAQEALASDDLGAATMALKEISVEADGPLKELAIKAAGATDIEAVRKEFVAISQEIRKIDLPEGTVLAFCPMADDGEGANWVQRKGEIANPYFGEKMLRCGTIEEEAKASQ